MTESHTLIVTVEGYPGGDERERSELGQALHDELHRVVDDVAYEPRSPESGAKGSAVEWATLIVQFAGTLPVLVGAIDAWRARHRGPAVSVSIDGDSITLEDASDAERAKLVEAWLRRHGGA
jgi:hypothetical protein